ncbi:class I SAM-dependent methyltransferase [Streptomyces sp. NPDC051364]|uniref:class I SAM-dependent methyltransferase n=1 Tax=Streptomyces sp. NPDC051364 TaxID=3155799 RepID=UPI003436FEA4
MTATAAYWEPLWVKGCRYRQLDEPKTRLLDEHLGPGRGRPALDIGCSDGALTRHLHHQLGYRATGIDCSPTALALAAAKDSADRPGPLWRCADKADYTNRAAYERRVFQVQPVRAVAEVGLDADSVAEQGRRDAGHQRSTHSAVRTFPTFRTWIAEVVR